MDREKGGGLKRLRDRWPDRLRVGERPAAGAEAGVVVEGLMNVSRRGVDTTDVLRRGLLEGRVFTFKLYRLDFETETSSLKADLLRLWKASKTLGSTFSLSEPPSGETARRLRDGAELGVIARSCQSSNSTKKRGKLSKQNRQETVPFCRFFRLCRLRILESFRMPNG